MIQPGVIAPVRSIVPAASSRRPKLEATVVRVVRSRGGGGGGGGGGVSGVFPLSISSNGRYLVNAQGSPFLINGDSPWMIVLNCTNAQIDTYLTTRVSQNINTVLIEAPGWYYSTQSPLYNNVDGQAPFTSTSYSSCSFNSINDTYWQRVDYFVNKAKSLGVFVLLCPAYAGIQGPGQGDIAAQGMAMAVNNASDADLQTYGQTLANRYTQGNVAWVMGGDYSGMGAKYWQIATGIRSVRPNDLITFHASRTQSAYTQVSGQTGFNLNNIYTDGVEYTYSATEYARSPAMPFFLIECYYEDDGALDAQGYRRQAYATILSGGCGHLMGHNEVWPFTTSGAFTSLNSTLANDLTRLWSLFSSYSWHLLQPKTDTSFVTTSLGTGTSRIIAALASDGSFGMVYTPTQNFTVAMSVFNHSGVRGRWYNPADGSFTTASGSPYSNSGTQSFTAPGERILVLD